MAHRVAHQDKCSSADVFAHRLNFVKDRNELLRNVYVMAPGHGQLETSLR